MSDLKANLEKRMEEIKEQFNKVSDRVKYLEDQQNKIYSEKESLISEMDMLRGSFAEIKRTMQEMGLEEETETEE